MDTENRLLIARGGRRGVGKMGEGDQKAQSPNYEIFTLQPPECNVRHDDYS